jgi:hypothetical protein
MNDYVLTYGQNNATCYLPAISRGHWNYLNFGLSSILFGLDTLEQKELFFNRNLTCYCLFNWMYFQILEQGSWYCK